MQGIVPKPPRGVRLLMQDGDVRYCTTRTNWERHDTYEAAAEGATRRVSLEDAARALETRHSIGVARNVRQLKSGGYARVTQKRRVFLTLSEALEARHVFETFEGISHGQARFLSDENARSVMLATGLVHIRVSNDVYMDRDGMYFSHRVAIEREMDLLFADDD